MKETLESLEEFATDVIYDRKKGLGADVLRIALRGLSFAWSGIVYLRLYLYRHRVLREHNLGCLVISIGNITVGGTGKTPVVELFARALRDAGRHVAILSRGYKSKRPPFIERMKSRFTGKSILQPPRVVSDGKNVLLDSSLSGDEPFMLASNLDEVVVLVDKDRVKSVGYAIREHGTDTILLDDGLQYLRLKHSLDIVLVDRNAPFGTGRLLPRGTLREPASSLKRAHYIFITKCRPKESNAELIKQIRKHNRTAEIIECRHAPRYLQNAFTNEKLPLEALKDTYIGTMSGIATPETFENSLTRLGAHVEARRRYTDHHRYTKDEVLTFLNHCVNRDLAMLVTTEKDAVRLPKIDPVEVPIYYLRVEIEILSGEETWRECIERICSPQSVEAANRLFT
ncbi:MAG: tetraacyldisaccharide 4'-kinase [Verrucomicrobiales bacterium]|jgi:tetraacyldisaccharide 4'-kinase